MDRSLSELNDLSVFPCVGHSEPRLGPEKSRLAYARRADHQTVHVVMFLDGCDGIFHSGGAQHQALPCRVILAIPPILGLERHTGEGLLDLLRGSPASGTMLPITNRSGLDAIEGVHMRQGR